MPGPDRYTLAASQNAPGSPWSAGRAWAAGRVNLSWRPLFLTASRVLRTRWLLILTPFTAGLDTEAEQIVSAYVEIPTHPGSPDTAGHVELVSEIRPDSMALVAIGG